MTPATTEKLNSPQVRQFSVFLQNKVGALLELVRLLDENNIVVLALSISESSETAISRMIVSDPDRTEEIFREHDIPSGVLAALLMAEVNVHFSYPLLVRPRGRALLAIHLDDIECASSVLMGEGFKLLNQGDLSR
jgi:hypothetical protein